MAGMACVSPVAMAEEVHQRAGEHVLRLAPFLIVLAVTDHEPGHGSSQANPQQPLVDAGPVRSTSGIGMLR